MARSIDTIIQSIKNIINSNPILAPIAALVNAPIASTSKRSHANMWVFIMASAQSTEEQLMDDYISQNEILVQNAAAASQAWIQDKMFQFQYDATTPQILQLDTSLDLNGLKKLVYIYPVIDPTKCIVTRCAVKKTAYKTVQIKIAVGTTPGKASSAQISAAQTYIDTIGNMGASYQVTSLDPDLLYLEGTVYYNGQYSAVIKSNVNAALTAFLALQSSQDNFGGSVRLSDIEGVIRSVTGVTDVALTNVAARAATTLFASKYYLLKNSTELDRKWDMVAGYIIQETTSGSTWSDKLIYTAE